MTGTIEQTGEQTETEAVVDAYLTAITEADPAKRAELIRNAWTEDCYFADPLFEAEGHQAVGEVMAAVLDQFPGHVCRRTTQVDSHHGLVRFGWELTPVDGPPAVTGLDVGVLADDGRLARVASFFDQTPAT